MLWDRVRCMTVEIHVEVTDAVMLVCLQTHVHVQTAAGLTRIWQ